MQGKENGIVCEEGLRCAQLKQKPSTELVTK